MKRIIVALDNMNESEIDHFLDNWKQKYPDQIPTIKIGLELFCKLGPKYIKEIHQKYQFTIFLDLKLHDVPNTVKKAISSLKGLPVQFLTIHLSGGRKMVEEAIKEAKNHLPNTRLLGVSFLTSLGSEDFFEMWGIEEKDIEKSFTRLISLALKTGIDGVVSSPKELSLIKKLEVEEGRKLIKVTPGIRFADEIQKGAIQDQKRVETPESAIKKGADYLVIGRSLTQSADLDKRIKELANLT